MFICLIDYLIFKKGNNSTNAYVSTDSVHWNTVFSPITVKHDALHMIRNSVLKKYGKIIECKGKAGMSNKLGKGLLVWETKTSTCECG